MSDEFLPNEGMDENSIAPSGCGAKIVLGSFGDEIAGDFVQIKGIMLNETSLEIFDSI